MEDSATPTGVDRGLPVALHSQISSLIRSRIASGRWPPHYRLKAEPDLAEDLGVSRGTLKRALATLISEGLLVQTRGRGTFVTSSAIEPSIAQKLSTLSEEFASQGVHWSTDVQVVELIDAPPPVAALLESATQRVLRLERLRHTEAGPVALLANFVRTDIAPGIEAVDFTRHSLFGVLEGRYGLQIASGRRTFSAQAADAETAAALGLGVGEPVQYLQQITYLSNGQPVEYSDVWIHSGRLQVTSILTRH